LFAVRITDEAIDDDSDVLVGTRLTSGGGNELTPKISGDGSMLAFTATYTGQREVYVLPLGGGGETLPFSNYTASRRRAIRVTYTANSYGVTSVEGWSKSSDAIYFSTRSLESSLDDRRIYSVRIRNPQANDPNGNVTPLPLTQSTEIAISSPTCTYFTRHKQSSQTKRYVGGTAESIWHFCSGDAEAVEITSDYLGTSRSPAVLETESARKYLIFVSDREKKPDGGWFVSGISNLWAIDVSKHNSEPTKITTTCDPGYGIQEFSIDAKNNNIIVRSGADLFFLKFTDVLTRLAQPQSILPMSPKVIEIRLLSDFNQMSERRIETKLDYLEDIDVMATKYFLLSSSVVVRGQSFLVPVVQEESRFRGPSTLPAGRTKQIVANLKNNGLVRVLNTKFLNSTHVIVLCTDPTSWNGAELGFFVSKIAGEGLFGKKMGGEKVGGEGLRSIRPESLTVSAKGRWAAWTDTDGRLMVMELSSGVTARINTVFRDFGKLVFDPTECYLSVEFTGKNQFTRIGLINMEDRSLNPVTMDRFNSYSPVFGEFALGGSIVPALFFSTDRDIKTDVTSPWGTRAPSPHFKRSNQLYALPLMEPNFDWQIIPELAIDGLDEVERKRSLQNTSSSLQIDFGDDLDEFSRRAEGVAGLNTEYHSLIAQTIDGECLLLIASKTDALIAFCGWDHREEYTVLEGVSQCGSSSDKKHIWCLGVMPEGKRVVVLSVDSFSSLTSAAKKVDLEKSLPFLAVEPELEFKSMFGDAHRMMRDYFYGECLPLLFWLCIYHMFLTRRYR